MQNQINLSPITQFVQSVRAAELSQSKEVKLSIQQARLLNLALTELLEKLSQDYETFFNELKTASTAEVVNVMMDGGDFNKTN